MRNNHSNNTNRLSFATGVLLVLTSGSAAIATLSDIDKFLPGFNDKDDSIDIGTVFWVVCAVSAAACATSFYKLYKNIRAEAEARIFAAIQAEPREQHGSSTETALLLFQNHNTSSMCSNFAWGLFGSLLSAGGFLGFLHYVRHHAENDPEHNFSSPVFTGALIAATVGVAVVTVLTGGLLLCAGRNRNQTESPGCWARLTSCCRSDSQNETRGQVPTTTSFSLAV